MHPDSTTPERVCEFCGGTMQRRPNEAPSRFLGRRLCSSDCAFKSRRGKSQARRTRASDLATRRCVICAREFERRDREPPGVFLRRRTCSVDCMYALSAKSHHRESRKSNKTCSVCGESYQCRQDETIGNFNRRTTCGKTQCFARLRISNRETPGLIPQSGYHSSFSESLRDEIRLRDGHKCRLCDVSASATKHPVHHIDYSKDNNVHSNLVTLCRSCHGKTHHHRDYWQRLFTAMLADMEAAA